MDGQQTPMKYDPATGWGNPEPSDAEQWRLFNGNYAWLFNPWTGERRDAAEVGEDMHGHMIEPPDECEPAATTKEQGNG